MLFFILFFNFFFFFLNKRSSGEYSDDPVTWSTADCIKWLGTLGLSEGKTFFFRKNNDTQHTTHNTHTQ